MPKFRACEQGGEGGLGPITPPFIVDILQCLIQNHDRALDFLNTLLTAEPQNRQANDLKAVIERRMRRGTLD